MLFLLLGTIVVATGVYCYRYQAQIIQRLVDEANKRLSHPIQMRAIQLTGLKTFPNIALTCYDVVVKDRIESARELITVRKIYCVFDIWQLVQGQYVLAHLYLEHGKFYLGADLGLSLGWETGVQKVAQREATLIVGLQKIHLKDIEILCGGKQQHCRISSEQMQASLKWEHSGLEADLQGKIMIRNIQLKDASFAQNLPLSLKAALSYDQQKKN